MTHNTGSLDGKINSPANEKSPKPASVLRNTCPENPSYTIATNYNPPTLDARSFPEVAAKDTGSLLGKISNSTNENYPKLAQSPGSGTGLEHLSNANIQVVKQKGLKAYFSEIVNGNPPVPDATPRSRCQPTQAQNYLILLLPCQLSIVCQMLLLVLSILWNTP
ncbi:hypothetical protein DSO57_1025453 [Entomophthora muscae]|uniref:Uncharacterized protein n=1 Tax=Entomophthora muscae TaxID=34485 RepID=A0ACC2UBZ0_9FUNG|nr:hypothetical protein DSO57_1025453 [Entomophthora muscae]